MIIELLHNNVLRILFSFIMSVGLIVYLIPKIVEISWKKGLVDKPNGRTVHSGYVPNLGGIAIIASIVLSSLMFWNISLIDGVQYRLVGILIIFFVGFIDDLMEMDHKKKFGGEIVASLIVIILGDVRLTSCHGFLGIYEIPYIASIALTLFVFLLIINAFNLIDGIDGLSSGIGIIISITFGIWFFLINKIELAVLASSIAGSLAAFFCFNVFSKKYKIFMGDSGALLIGFLIAILSVRFNELNLNATSQWFVNSSPVISAGILAIPLFDTARVMFIRLLRNQSPFKADRRHMHHMLLDLKLTHLQATSVLVGINIGIIVMMMVLQQYISNIIVLSAILVTLILSLSAIPYQLLTKRKRESKHISTTYFSLD